jgi:hypothetical protein
MVMICVSFSLISLFKYNGVSYKKPFMSAICSSDGHLFVFTWVAGMVCSDVWEECTATIFRVT